MQRKSKKIQVSSAIETLTLLCLPEEAILFSYLLIVDLLEVKRVSKNFKQTVDDYIKKSESNIFYAASLECKVPIGQRISYAELERDGDLHTIYDYIEYPASRLDVDYIKTGDVIKKRALSYFYNHTLSNPGRSLLLFKSEAEALDFFRFPGTTSSGYLCRMVDYDRYYVGSIPRQLLIQVSPIYKVQFVHSNKVEEDNEEK